MQFEPAVRLNSSEKLRLNRGCLLDEQNARNVFEIVEAV